MVTYTQMRLYQSFEIETSPGVYTKYYEDSLHRPVFPAPVDASSVPPEPRMRLYVSNDVTPRKGHELDEIEVAIKDEIFTVQGCSIGLPQLICL